MVATCRCDPKLLHSCCCTCVAPYNRKVKVRTQLLPSITYIWLTRNHTERTKSEQKSVNSLEKTTKSHENTTKSQEVEAKSHQCKWKSHRTTGIPNKIKWNHIKSHEIRQQHSKSREIATKLHKMHEIMLNSNKLKQPRIKAHIFAQHRNNANMTSYEIIHNHSWSLEVRRNSNKMTQNHTWHEIPRIQWQNHTKHKHKSHTNTIFTNITQNCSK